MLTLRQIFSKVFKRKNKPPQTKRKFLQGIWQKLHSIQTRMVLMLIFISFIPVFITGLNSYLQAEKILMKKLETTSIQTIREVGKGIDDYFISVSNLAQILAKDSNIIEADNPDKLEAAKGLIANIGSTDSKIFNINIGTEEGTFYSYPERAFKNSNYKTASWYQDSLKQKDKITYSKPWKDPTGFTVISISTPITNNDKVIGVVGIDINLSYLTKEMAERKIGDNGYVYIADQDGYIITHPNTVLIGTDAAANFSFWPEAVENGSGFASYEFYGEELFGSYVTNEATNWKIVAAMTMSELTNDTGAIQKTFIIVLVTMVIISIISAVLFTRPIYRKIMIVVSGFQKVVSGDLTAQVTIKSKDEFSILGQQFNNMVESMSQIVKNVADSSANVLDASVELANMAEETSASISEVSRAVEEVSHGASEQAQYSAEGASGVSDLADRMNQIEEATNIIDSLTYDANLLTTQGLGRVEELIQKSNSTEASTEQVSALVLEMSQSMERITAISNTIDMITEQTNLLSLNASIEAARSGEAGRGFAVVANEIRKLAEQSKASTVQIKATINEIQQKTELSVNAMNQTKETVKEQVAVVDQTQKVFQEIMNAVNNLTTRVSEIKKYTEYMAEKKDNIVDQIENISAISEETASASEEVTASTEQIASTMDEISKYASNLNQLAEELKSKVNQFKIME